MNSILVVDDDQSMREFLEILLTREGYKVNLAASGEEACRIIGREAFDLVISDIRMKDVDGIEVLRKTKQISPETMEIQKKSF